MLFWSPLSSDRVWCAWPLVWKHHEWRAWCLGCGESTEGLSCWPPQQTSYCWRSRLLAGPHSVPRPPQSASRLLCVIGKILWNLFVLFYSEQKFLVERLQGNLLCSVKTSCRWWCCNCQCCNYSSCMFLFCLFILSKAHNWFCTRWL